MLDVIHRLLDLVDDRPVSGRPGAPLRAVNRPQIAILVGPLIPDADTIFLQIGGIGIAIEEPEQLVNDGAQVALLGSHQRETFRQIEAHLMAEQGDSTGAGTV